MSLPVVAIRPEPGLSDTIARGAALGLDMRAFPLFEIEPRAWDAPDPAEIDGLLLGSVNAVRHGGADLARFRDKPVYAVGEATAAAAREAGFEVAGTGPSALQKVLEGLAGKRLTLLRPAGDDHVPLAALPGIEVITRVAYASVARPLPEEAAAVLRGSAVVLLHSGVAARHFVAECERLGLDRSAIAIAALAPRIAAAAGEGWRARAVAADPADPALLALARDMCHGGGPPARHGNDTSSERG